MTENSLVDAAKASIEAYGKKDWKAARQGFATNVKYEEFGTGRKFDGVDKVIEAYEGWSSGIPDSKASIGTAIQSGNTVVLEITWRGHHTGPLMAPDGSTLKASGKSIEVPACQVIGFEGGKITRVRHYFDLNTLLTQVGAMPKAPGHMTPTMR